MADDIAIKVDSVSKTFKLPHEKNSSIKGAVLNFYKRNKGYETQEVLKDVSFEIKKGEFFGIVGRNGSGKSTLLKLMAGIYTPSGGGIQINGKLTPFIELGVGFNPELTGRENVFLNGALLGFSRKEMEAMYDDIVEFAEIQKFMDQKLKNYSSGMQVRLAFSIAIRAKSDILLIDEVLAVGDSNFQKKCFDVFADFKRQKRTIVLVTHDMSSVEEYCDRAMLINNGDVVRIGEANEVTKEYNDLNVEATIAGSSKHEYQMVGSKESTKAEIISCAMLSGNEKKYVFRPDEAISIKLKIKYREAIEGLIAGITIYDQLSHPLFATNTQAEKIILEKYYSESNTIEITFEVGNVLSDGTYYVSPEVSSDNGRTIHDSIEEPIQFKTAGWDYPAYLLQPPHKVSVKVADAIPKETK